MMAVLKRFCSVLRVVARRRWLKMRHLALSEYSDELREVDSYMQQVRQMFWGYVGCGWCRCSGGSCAESGTVPVRENKLQIFLLRREFFFKFI